jgi:hypothetical protein
MAVDGPALVGLSVSGTFDGWADAGFAVDDDLVTLGSVRIRNARGAGDGILAWSLSGVDDGAIDGLLTVAGEPAPQPMRHPNGTVAIDHLVVASPDLDRTTEALGAFGVELRRRRDAGRMEQRFFRLGPVILELIGEPGEHGPGPASFWGLAVTVDDIDSTAALLGDHLGPVTDAVQPGRRIATLRHEALDIPVPIAFLTPNPPPSAPP